MEPACLETMPMSKLDHPRTGTVPALAAGEKLDRDTFHERYEAMPPTARAELIGGVVYMPSPLSADDGVHNIPVVVWLDHYVEFTPGVRASLSASILLDDLGEPQPDVSLRILPEYGGQTRLEGGFIAGAPELVIEIARSSRVIDLGAKLQDYERARVQEYVVVELDPNQIHWFVRRGGRLVDDSPGSDGLYRSAVFPGLWLDPEALFAGDRSRLRAAVDLGLATPEHA
jgi:Uma2 family endonuclease